MMDEKQSELCRRAKAEYELNSWYVDPAEIQKHLMDLARDERVIGAAACNVDLTPRFSTPGFPDEFRCAAVGRRVRTTGALGDNTSRLQEWSTVATLPTGRVHVSVMPITFDDQDLGYAILVHDLSFIERRESQARRFLFIASGFLALMAFGVPMFVAKWARYGWSLELRGLIRGVGKQNHREFQPILTDLRELVGRMANDREDAPGLWTAERLKQDAQALADAGAFAIVLELIPAPLASRITTSLAIPTIGIGAGPACDGQVLVLHDILGLNDQFNAKFVKRYATLSQDVREAVELFAAEVREGRYPGPEHSF